MRAADANGDLYNWARSSGRGSALTLRTAEQLGELTDVGKFSETSSFKSPRDFGVMVTKAPLYVERCRNYASTRSFDKAAALPRSIDPG